MKKRTLVTCWSHPEADQELVIPGTIKETREMALSIMLGDLCSQRNSKPETLQGIEKFMSDSKLKALREYEG